MQVWNVLHTAHCKYRTQKGCKTWPSVHHHTTLTGYIFTTKACIDSWKKLVKQQYLLHMPSQYGELRSTNGQARLVGLGHPSKFQRGLRLGFVTAATSLNGSPPNFTRCLAVWWAGILYIDFRGVLLRNRILPGAKFTLCPSLGFSCFGSVNARHWSSGRHPNFAAWYKEWNYGTFAPHHFQQRAPPIFQGRPSRWA